MNVLSPTILHLPLETTIQLEDVESCVNFETLFMCLAGVACVFLVKPSAALMPAYCTQ